MSILKEEKKTGELCDTAPHKTAPTVWKLELVSLPGDSNERSLSW